MIGVLIDINVVLDVFLARSPWLAESAAVFDANQRREIVAYLSALFFPTRFDLVRRNADLPMAHRVVAECLNSFEIISLDRTTLEPAQSMPGSDFEDNLQAAGALQANLGAIVTRDPKGFAGSSMTIWSPAELLVRAGKPSDA